MRATVTILLAAWFALVLSLGAIGAFAVPAGEPPAPILLGVGAPVVLFLITYALVPAFRAFVHDIDLGLATAIQSWRFAGFGFLALYTYGVLPGSFAWPAGLGDIAIGLSAPWIALALKRRPAFAASPAFVVWNLLGVLDLIVAVGSGAANSLLATGSPGEITTQPMAVLPLVLIPCFFVPLFLILHIVALVQSRQLARRGATDSRAERRVSPRPVGV